LSGQGAPRRKHTRGARKLGYPRRLEGEASCQLKEAWSCHRSRFAECSCVPYVARNTRVTEIDVIESVRPLRTKLEIGLLCKEPLQTKILG